jgi:glycosyltransferase involved in cell wall biosynthesis
MSESTLVSVIIPVHNGESFLADAIRSVLGQQHSPLEIIVVDDGSTDRSAETARHFGRQVRYHYQQNAGVASARNTGLEHATGSIIGFLDQDDRWAPDKLRIMLPCFQADPAIDVIYGMTVKTTVLREKETGRVIERFGEPYFNWVLGSALFRRPVFTRIGGFDEAVRYHADDTDFFLRLRESGLRIQYIDHVALYYYLHGGNTSLNTDTPRRMFLVEVLKRSLDRRRSADDMSISPLPDFVRSAVEKPDTGQQHE